MHIGVGKSGTILKVFRTCILVCDISFAQILPNNLPHGMVLVFLRYFWEFPNFWSTLRQIPREGLVGLAYVHLCLGCFRCSKVKWCLDIKLRRGIGHGRPMRRRSSQCPRAETIRKSQKRTGNNTLWWKAKSNSSSAVVLETLHECHGYRLPGRYISFNFDSDLRPSEEGVSEV